MRGILCFFLVLVAVPAWAEWVKVSENKDATFYIDPATIRKDGNLRRVREMQDLKTRDNDGEMSLQSLEEYDCKAKRNRTLAFATFSDPKGRGKMLYSTNSSDKWNSIPPSTPALVILNRVCAR